MGNEYEKQKKEKLEELEKLIFDLRTKGKSYEDIGAFANVASSTIYRIAEGETSPRMKTITKLLDSLKSESKEGRKPKQTIENSEAQAYSAQKGGIQEGFDELMEDIVYIINSPDTPLEIRLGFFSSLRNLVRTYRRTLGQIEDQENKT